MVKTCTTFSMYSVAYPQSVRRPNEQSIKETDYYREKVEQMSGVGQWLRVAQLEQVEIRRHQLRRMGNEMVQNDKKDTAKTK